MVDKKEEPKVEEVKTVVVKDLPQQDIRAFTAEDGKPYDVITTEEAITEILESIRAIKKSVA